MRSAALLPIALLLIAACGTSPRLEAGAEIPDGPLFVPAAAAPRLDGVLGDEEWREARVFPMNQGGQVRLLRSGNRLYIGVRYDRQPGTTLLALARENEIRIGRGSGIQATIRYSLDAGSWRRRNNFSWVEVAPGDAAAVDEHLGRAGWVAVSGGPDDGSVVEYCVNIPREGLRLALSKIGTRRGKPHQHWPAGLEDDLVGALLTGEIAPEILQFDPDRWAQIAPQPAEAQRLPLRSAADDGSPLEGAWRVAEIRYVWDGGEAPIRTPQPGQFLFVDGSYSMVWHQQFKRQPDYADAWRPTDPERIAAYNGIVVNSGTYELRGDTLITLPAVAKSVEFEGGEARWLWRAEADTLWLRSGVTRNYKGEMDPGSEEMSSEVRCERIR